MEAVGAVGVQEVPEASRGRGPVEGGGKEGADAGEEGEAEGAEGVARAGHVADRF